MTVRTSGFTFVAVESTTGVKHLAFAGPENFGHTRYMPPHGRTLCGRLVHPDWSEIGAREWYAGPLRKCPICGGRVGPYATVRLRGDSNVVEGNGPT